MLTRQIQRPLTIALGAIGAILVVLGMLYLVTKAGSLPSFLPGHVTPRVGKKGHAFPTHAHTKLGAVLLIAAIGSLAGAWWVGFQYEPAN